MSGRRASAVQVGLLSHSSHPYTLISCRTGTAHQQGACCQGLVAGGGYQFRQGHRPAPGDEAESWRNLLGVGPDFLGPVALGLHSPLTEPFAPLTL